jgi:hypothetical protein
MRLGFDAKLIFSVRGTRAIHRIGPLLRFAGLASIRWYSNGIDFISLDLLNSGS